VSEDAGLTETGCRLRVGRLHSRSPGGAALTPERLRHVDCRRHVGVRSRSGRRLHRPPQQGVASETKVSNTISPPIGYPSMGLSFDPVPPPLQQRQRRHGRLADCFSMISCQRALKWSAGPTPLDHRQDHGAAATRSASGSVLAEREVRTTQHRAHAVTVSTGTGSPSSAVESGRPVGISPHRRFDGADAGQSATACRTGATSVTRATAATMTAASASEGARDC
jgi:hypothetical protein